jgi:hypothetical protein
VGLRGYVVVNEDLVKLGLACDARCEEVSRVVGSTQVVLYEATDSLYRWVTINSASPNLD